MLKINWIIDKKNLIIELIFKGILQWDNKLITVSGKVRKQLQALMFSIDENYCVYIQVITDRFQIIINMFLKRFENYLMLIKNTWTKYLNI